MIRYRDNDWCRPRKEVPMTDSPKLACRRCGGWGHIRLGNMDRERCDLCLGDGADPSSGHGQG